MSVNNTLVDVAVVAKAVADEFNKRVAPEIGKVVGVDIGWAETLVKGFKGDALAASLHAEIMSKARANQLERLKKKPVKPPKKC